MKLHLCGSLPVQLFEKGQKLFSAVALGYLSDDFSRGNIACEYNENGTGGDCYYEQVPTEVHRTQVVLPLARLSQ